MDLAVVLAAFDEKVLMRGLLVGWMGKLYGLLLLTLPLSNSSFVWCDSSLTRNQFFGLLSPKIDCPKAVSGGVIERRKEHTCGFQGSMPT
jgi:hypothetical protein